MTHLQLNHVIAKKVFVDIINEGMRKIPDYALEKGLNGVASFRKETHAEVMDLLKKLRDKGVVDVNMPFEPDEYIRAEVWG